jgi:uncharacterized protein
MFKRISLIATLALVAQLTHAQLAIPPHGGVWVHDQAGVLSAQTKAELEYLLKAERDSTSNQIAVLVLTSLEGEDIDDYTNRVFREWKLGQADKDNGVLFLIAINDRKMRIEPGFGLEGALTDAIASRINRNEVAPYFRQGDYENGIKAGTLAIVRSIKGEYKNDEPVQRKSKRGSALVNLIILIVILFFASRRRGGGGSGLGNILMTGALMRGFGGSSGSWGGGADFGGGGDSGGGGSSDSW